MIEILPSTGAVMDFVLADQAETTDLRMADGVFCKTIRVRKAHRFIPQHSHSFAHVSVVVRGAVRLWRDGVLGGDFQAPIGVTIAAHVKHLFETLEDETIILCVHDIGTAEGVKIDEEHQIVGGV